MTTAEEKITNKWRKQPDGKMHPELKELWLKALRSGDYKQVKRYLHLENQGHCCLGVLCEVMGVPRADEQTIQENYGQNHKPAAVIYDFGHTRLENANIPHFIASALGIAYHQDPLQVMNDSREWTFNQIAAYIEENL